MHELIPQPKPGRGRLQDLNQEQKKAILVGTYTKDKQICIEQLDELENLGNTYGLQTILKLPCPIRSYDAGIFIGSGKVEEIKALAIDGECDLIIFDDEISPQQQRNLEKAWKCKVIDRTALILVGPALAARDFRESALYDPDYRRRFRGGGGPGVDS